MRTVPEVLFNVVVRIEIVVVLPAPFGPRNANSSPSATWKLTPATAGLVAFLYCLRRLSTSMTAVMSCSLLSVPGWSDPRRSSRTLGSRHQRRITAVSTWCKRREVHGERGAAARLAGDSDLALVQFDDAAGQCESEAVAAGTASLVRPVEAFEDVRQVRCGDADARVDHLHLCRPGGLRRHADLDPAPGGGELHGVLHEVGPHLREQAGVRLDAHR